MKFVPTERVKYLLRKYEIRCAYEMCCSHGGTKFISLCGIAAKFHNDRRSLFHIERSEIFHLIGDISVNYMGSNL